MSKILNLLVCLDRLDFDQEITVEKTTTGEGTDMNLKKGEKIKIRDLAYGMMLGSANDAAEYLASCAIQTVLTDAVSIAPQDNEAAVHSILMRAGIAILENAALDAVPDGDYLLFAFPLKIAGSDGAPVRAVLVGPGK